MRVLNLYAGIGGNRKLWGGVQVTAVELDPQIADIYKDFFPYDNVIVGDDHKYLLEHFGEFDFIWASPPCPTHSRINMANHISPYKDNKAQIEHGGGCEPRYPDMTLWQEIIFLKYYFKGKYCVENVISYYEPLIRPTELGRHYFWTNFLIPPINLSSDNISSARNKNRSDRLGFDLKKYKVDKRKGTILRNCVSPILGAYILKQAMKKEDDLFKLTPSLLTRKEV